MAIVGNSTVLVPSSVSAGAAVDASTLERKTVSVEGTFTATVQVQISLDPSNPPASTSWLNEGAALTSAGTLEISKPCNWLRANVTAYTSGTMTGRLCGVVKVSGGN